MSHSGIGRQIKLVMQLMANRDSCRANRVWVGRSRLVSTKGPFAVVIQRQRHSGDAAAAGAASDTLQTNGFKFFNGLLAAVHSGLLAIIDSITGDKFPQERVA